MTKVLEMDSPFDLKKLLRLEGLDKNDDAELHEYLKVYEKLSVEEARELGVSILQYILDN